MKSLRLLPLCVVLLSLACASSKNPTTDDGPAASAGEAGDAGDGGVGGEGGEAAEAGAGEAAEAGAGEDGGQACSSDADCVPAQCCHPTSCVPAGEAPDCSDVACTEDCQGGTMDCGQGHCACQDGTCAAVIDQPLE